MKVTLGGDRLGSGNKNKVSLHEYGRSTHNLSYQWRSTMAPGICYPFLKFISTKGDRFEIDLQAAARTIPTKAPLFGSYKMQIDIFQCPIKNYIGLLHNNPLHIGLNMSQVKFPKLEVKADGDTTAENIEEIKRKDYEFANNCLIKYLGLSGLGVPRTDGTDYQVVRRFNALALLAYYDIWKNYYSNKQEEKAPYIGAGYDTIENEINVISKNLFFNKNEIIKYNKYEDEQGSVIIGDWGASKYEIELEIKPALRDIDWSKIYIRVQYASENITGWQYNSISIQDFIENRNEEINNNIFKVKLNYNDVKRFIERITQNNVTDIGIIEVTADRGTIFKPFLIKYADLENFDTMRYNILSHHILGEPFILNNYDIEPYNTLWENHTENNKIKNNNMYSHNGLMLKTYQSDIFNNWIKTDWIDGENGIAEITKIATTNGSFSIDQLNLAEKLYNMLNRVAVTDGTYYAWEDAVYTSKPRNTDEVPMYCGGMSCEVVFEEIIQTAPAEGDPLGTLGGRGVLIKRKGGHVNINVDKASYIIGIVSLTPRINYSQGNEFDMTELDSMDDLHKPALDGIGFQDLLQERMAYWGTIVEQNGEEEGNLIKLKAGKIPAWSEWTTNVDKCYGDFAQEEGKSYMVLNRNYEGLDGSEIDNGITDCTTYVDPSKYNYSFAYTELDSQNFWAQINCDVKKRWIGGAKQIPNI